MAKAARYRGSKLTRRLPSRDPKRRLLILCEDTNSAPLYFSAMRKAFPLTALTIVPGAGTPDAIARQAVEKARGLGLAGGQRTRRPWYEQRDEVWAVFDRDEHEHFDAAVAECVNNGVLVARSNPCFEVWIILHFEEYHKPQGRHKAFDRACSVCPSYKDGKGRGVDYAKLISRIEVAEDRAERQLAAREQEGVPFGPPSTTVFRLTRSIRKA